jgi:hypothetical protein
MSAGPVDHFSPGHGFDALVSRVKSVVQNAAKALLIPVGYLAELAAVLQLQSWEEAGLQVHLDAGLPTSFKAGSELARQYWEHPELFRTFESASLFPRVFRVWLDRVAWCGPELLGAEIAIDLLDEESLLAAISEFLWKNRALGSEEEM